MRLEDLQSKKIGLVLSGGGVKGIAHIGLIKALNEFDINVDVISGSSAGALVGALYANGSSVEQMLSFFKETPLVKYNFLTFAKPGLIDTVKYYNLFLKRFNEDSFQALNKKLFVTATNLQEGTQRQFYRGELINTLLASAALPPVFSPIEIEGQLYADGGIMNNFPVEPLIDDCEFIIGSNVGTIEQIPKKAINSSLKLANRVTSLMIYATYKAKLQHCNLIFEPEQLETFGILDKKGIERAFTIGYDHAMNILNESIKS
ncbi:patatin-like phospholipase family protein [Aurantibacter sp.]|uniref:patatin-like phospholipase family protein n=1 Tax=Aurantibacter sp. TaxID=2807103 RepID=UPI003264CD13